MPWTEGLVKAAPGQSDTENKRDTRLPGPERQGAGEAQVWEKVWGWKEAWAWEDGSGWGCLGSDCV